MKCLTKNSQYLRAGWAAVLSLSVTIPAGFRLFTMKDVFHAFQKFNAITRVHFEASVVLKETVNMT